MLYTRKHIKKELNRVVFLSPKGNRDIAVIKYAGHVTIIIDAQNSFLSDKWYYQLEIQVDEQDNLFMREAEEQHSEKIDRDFTYECGEHL